MCTCYIRRREWLVVIMIFTPKKNIKTENADTPLSKTDFEEALANVNKSVSHDDLDRFDKWMEEFGSV